MRNIIIAGPARAGKTSLSRMIRKKYPIYQSLSGDTIRHAYNISLFQDKTDHEIGQTPEYKVFLNNYYRSSVDWNHDLRFILDLTSITPKELLDIVPDDSIIIFIGYANRTVQEIIKRYRKYDNIKQWTFGLLQNDLKGIAEDNQRDSNICKEQCEKYNIKYVDVYENRKERFKEIMEWLEIENIKMRKNKDS